MSTTQNTDTNFSHFAEHTIQLFSNIRLKSSGEIWIGVSKQVDCCVDTYFEANWRFSLLFIPSRPLVRQGLQPLFVGQSGGHNQSLEQTSSPADRPTCTGRTRSWIRFSFTDLYLPPSACPLQYVLEVVFRHIHWFLSNVTICTYVRQGRNLYQPYLHGPGKSDGKPILQLLASIQQSPEHDFLEQVTTGPGKDSRGLVGRRHSACWRFLKTRNSGILPEVNRHKTTSPHLSRQNPKVNSIPPTRRKESTHFATGSGGGSGLPLLPPRPRPLKPPRPRPLHLPRPRP